MPCRRTVAHVSVECIEREPSVAYRDPAPPIVYVRSISPVEASPFDVTPYSVYGSVAHTVRLRELISFSALSWNLGAIIPAPSPFRIRVLFGHSGHPSIHTIILAKTAPSIISPRSTLENVAGEMPIIFAASRTGTLCAHRHLAKTSPSLIRQTVSHAQHDYQGMRRNFEPDKSVLSPWQYSCRNN